MVKSKLFRVFCLALILAFGIAEKAKAECSTSPCGEYKIIIEYEDFRTRQKKIYAPVFGYYGKIGDTFNLGVYMYVRTNIDCPPAGEYGFLRSLGRGYNPKVISIQDWEGDFPPCYPNGQPPDDPNKSKKYFLWVDTFRGNKGILWGIFQGAPDGCTVVGAYIDGDNITRYKGNLNDSEVDFGYELIKSKEGYESPPIDFDKLPINYRDSNYEEYYFRANWVSPNCYWQVREVRRNSFGGVFDFLWNLF